MLTDYYINAEVEGRAKELKDDETHPFHAMRESLQMAELLLEKPFAEVSKNRNASVASIELLIDTCAVAINFIGNGHKTVPNYMPRKAGLDYQQYQRYGAKGSVTSIGSKKDG